MFGRDLGYDIYPRWTIDYYIDTHKDETQLTKHGLSGLYAINLHGYENNFHTGII